MRTGQMFLASLVVLVVSTPVMAQGGGRAGGGGPARPALTLTIPGFPDGGEMPARFTQAGEGAAPGEGTSPAVNWMNVPEGTQSFVLSVRDLDLVRNRGTENNVHWLVWNIPATATGLPEGVPRGAQLANGASQTSVTGPVYRGPGSPATGPFHHYAFELFALDSTLTVQSGADAFETRANVMKAVEGHVIGVASYVGRFKRPQ